MPIHFKSYFFVMKVVDTVFVIFVDALSFIISSHVIAKHSTIITKYLPFSKLHFPNIISFHI